MQTKVSHHISGAVRLFAFWVANRTAGQPLLDGIDYSVIFEEPGALEMTFAIFINCLELDENGKVLNAKKAEIRAAQYIRAYVDSEYEVEPNFEAWETNLH